MRINVSTTPQYYCKYKYKNQNNSNIQKNNDSISEPAFGRHSKDSQNSLLDRIKNFVGINVNKPVPTYSWAEVTPFHKELAEGIKRRMEIDIPPANLHNIMTPKEIREILPALNENMFNNTKENIENGIYCAELDYPSNFSDGNECSYEILDKIAVIADDYNKKTGKKFIFAIADRDNLGGVQHAIRTFGENPEKYKNIKFIPAVKLTFVHEAPESKLKYENSEMIVYGINPYSENLIQFTIDTIKKRQKNTLGFIRDIYNLYPEVAYNIIEFAEQNKLRYYKDYGISNLYWRAREYAQTKGDATIKGISVPPEDVIAQAEEILNKLDIVLTGSSYKQKRNNTTIINPDEKLNKDISEVFDNYSTKKQAGLQEMTSSFENSYEQVISCLEKEAGGENNSKPIIAISSPYYLSYLMERNPQLESYPNVIKFINELQSKSNGMLAAFESTSPQYEKDNNIDKNTISNFNKYLRQNTSLFEVGGSLITGIRHKNSEK